MELGQVSIRAYYAENFKWNNTLTDKSQSFYQLRFLVLMHYYQPLIKTIVKSIRMKLPHLCTRVSFFESSIC